MKYVKILSTFILLFSLSAMAKVSQIKEIEISLEKRIKDLLINHDSKAFVHVTVVPNTAKTKLPLTPFSYDIINTTESGLVKLKNIEVNIYSNKKEIPVYIKSVIEKLGQDYGAKPEIRVQEIKLIKIDHIDYFRWEFIVGGMLLLAMGVYLLSQWYNKRYVVRNMDKVASSIDKLSSSLSVDLRQGNLGAQKTERAGGGSTNINLSTSTQSIWENFDLSNYLALISDCYWCFEDRYARFVWEKISVDKKNALLKQNPFLIKYATYILSIEPEDIHAEQDPYYINPLPIHHLDNESVATEVRENAQLFYKLSDLRAGKIPLTVTERLELMDESRARPLTELKNYSSVTASEQRDLKVMKKMVLNSIDEERELLSKDDIPLNVIETIPTLGWILKLDETNIKQMLEKYSARDLAQAWIAPDEVLDQMSSYLPESKMNLINSYLENTNPDRNGVVFNSLFNDIMEALKENHLEVEDENEFEKRSA